jgi:oligopeptide transport system substrate-binding protein
VRYLSDSKLRRQAKQVALAPLSDLTTFDPGRLVDSVTQFWMGHVYEGLMTYDEKGAVVPAAAESLEVSSDGRTVRAKLRAGLRWHDEKPVTANDFAYALKRVASPAFASEYSFVLETARIKNAGAVISGKMPPDTLGVIAVSDDVIVFHLDGPSALLPELLTLNLFSPVRKDLVEKYGDKFGRSLESVVGNGPFRVSTWEGEAPIVLAKAQMYWNAAKIRLESIAFPFATASFLTSYQSFVTGGIDTVTALDVNTLHIAQKAGRATKFLGAGAQWSLLFNMRPNAPFADVRLRRALALALNRNEYISRIHGLPGAKPAYGIVPDYILGSALTQRFRKEAPMPPWKVDLAKGRSLAKDVALSLPTGKLPPLRFVAVGNDSNRSEADYFHNEISKVFGTSVKMELPSFKVRMQKIRDGDFDVTMSAWIPDYNDPLTFLEIFESNSVYNASGYANKAFDMHIAKAKNLPRGKERTKTLAAAERLLLRDAVVIPYRQSSKIFLEHPDLQGIRRRSLGMDPDFRFAEWQ